MRFWLACLAGVATLVWAHGACTIGSRTPAVSIARGNETRLSIDIKVGQVFELKTAPSPVTAYRWDFDHGALKILRTQGAVSFEDEKNGAIPGGERRTVFRFSGVSVGQVDLRFAFFAGHEFPGFDTADQFTLHVNVR